MRNIANQIEHTFADAPPELRELASYVPRGELLGASARGFIETNGPIVARQLLRYMTDLPSRAGCATTAQFLIGHATKGGSDPESLDDWNRLLAEAFSLAQADDLNNLSDGPYEFVKRVLPLIRNTAVIASPCMIAWGMLPKE